MKMHFTPQLRLRFYAEKILHDIVWIESAWPRTCFRIAMIIQLVPKIFFNSMDEGFESRGLSEPVDCVRFRGRGLPMLSDDARQEAIRYVPNQGFTEAVVTFADGSTLTFHHSSRENRWSKA